MAKSFISLGCRIMLGIHRWQQSIMVRNENMVHSGVFLVVVFFPCLLLHLPKRIQLLKVWQSKSLNSFRTQPECAATAATATPAVALVNGEDNKSNCDRFSHWGMKRRMNFRSLSFPRIDISNVALNTNNDTMVSTVHSTTIPDNVWLALVKRYAKRIEFL